MNIISNKLIHIMISSPSAHKNITNCLTFHPDSREKPRKWIQLQGAGHTLFLQEEKYAFICCFCFYIFYVSLGAKLPAGTNGFSYPRPSCGVTC